MFKQTTTFTNVTENSETEDGGDVKQAAVNMVFDSTEMTYHEMVEYFERFLKAMGYTYDGKFVYQEKDTYGIRSE